MEDSSRTVACSSGSQEVFFVAVAKDEHAGNSHSLRNIFTRRGILRSPVAIAVFFGLIALSLFLSGIRNPAQPYYDEGFYIPAARAILANTPGPNNGSPPLGKLLIAEGIRLLGDNPLGWRVPGAIFGSLALVAVFLWTFLLSRDVGIAALAAGLTLLNNFLFVMSRLAMLDVFLVSFILWSLVHGGAGVGAHCREAKNSAVLRGNIFGARNRRQTEWSGHAGRFDSCDLCIVVARHEGRGLLGLIVSLCTKCAANGRPSSGAWLGGCSAHFL
jgi:dolichyl-phosphate-mannose-protein mannosyltransferase